MPKVATKKIVGIKASTLAMFEGTFAGAIGLFLAILHSLNTTVEMADATNSVLKGLTFGLATGIVSILVVPLIYFGIGWLIGYVHGWVFNLIVGASGGLDIDIQD